MTIEKAYLVTLKGKLVNAYYRAGYTDEDIAKFWNEKIAKQIAEAVQIKLQAPNALKVEARPVKRGKWEYEDTIGGMKHYHCTNCDNNGSACIADENQILWWEFCPRCGVRMGLKDGEIDE